MQIKTALRFQLTIVRMAKIKKKVTAVLGRMWRQRNSLPFLSGLEAFTTTLEISLAVPLIIEQSTTRCPAIPLLGLYPEDVLTFNKDTCSTMFIAALFIIARIWK
jgi:hypothetical protein